MECIILAGGLGTRLAADIEEVPKCMAPVNGEPFLEYIFRYLETQFVDHVILSLGFRHRVVADWLNGKAYTFQIQRVIEQEQMGTGGGLKLALRKAKEAKTFILNGDTLFKVDLRKMQQVIQPTDKAVVALKPMKDFDRFGAVKMNENGLITRFEEKQPCVEGLINGGVYLLNNAAENFFDYPEKFSLEKDFLEPEAQNGKLRGFVDDSYFIDIGIPKDYHRAEKELA